MPHGADGQSTSTAPTTSPQAQGQVATTTCLKQAVRHEPELVSFIPAELSGFKPPRVAVASSSSVGRRRRDGWGTANRRMEGVRLRRGWRHAGGIEGTPYRPRDAKLFWDHLGGTIEWGHGTIDYAKRSFDDPVGGRGFRPSTTPLRKPTTSAPPTLSRG